MNNVEERRLADNKHLKNEIIYGNNYDSFKVWDVEAGAYKSRGAEEGIVELYNINPSKFVIMVLKNQDCIVTEDKLALSHKRINELAGKDIALAIDTFNKDKAFHSMKNYPVLIITHAMYKVLSKDENRRKHFSKGRSVLIIDEFIDMVDTFSYGVHRIKEFAHMLEDMWSLKKIYLECVEEIVKRLKEYEENNVKFIKFDIEKINFDQIKELRELIDKNIDDVYAMQYIKNGLTGKDGNVEKMKKIDFMNEIDAIENMYKNLCYYDEKYIHSYDHDIKYWLLPENNIILDANGSFNGCYKLNSNLFKCSYRPKVFDHSQWNVFVSNTNVTQTAVNLYKGYHEKVLDYVKSITKEEDKVLLICSKSQKVKFEKLGFPRNVTIEYNGNIIGRNDWRFYNKVIIVQVFNLPKYGYIMNYLFYTGDDIEINTAYNPMTPNQMRQFEDERLEMLRVSFIAGHLYQGIKRIDRDVSRNSEVYIMCADKVITDLVVSNLDKCKVHELDLSFEKKEKKKISYKTKSSEDFQVGKLIMLLGELRSGKYSKKKLRNDLEITQAANFSRLFKKVEVRQFMEEHNISNLTHYLEVA